jgi:hypothetical protein
MGVEDMDQIPGRRLREAIERIAEVTRGRSATGLSHDDDNDDLGTIASDDAIGFDPLPVLRALAEHEAPAVVIGQVAGILHGSAELTGDLDLLWSGDPADAHRMTEAFASLPARLYDDDRRPVTGAEGFALPKVLFRAPSACGDCCTPRLPWGGLDVVAFLGRAEVTDVDGVRVRYLAVDDLLAMRRASSRPKDLRRIAELERLFPHLGR